MPLHMDTTTVTEIDQVEAALRAAKIDESCDWGGFGASAPKPRRVVEVAVTATELPPTSALSAEVVGALTLEDQSEARSSAFVLALPERVWIDEERGEGPSGRIMLLLVERPAYNHVPVED